MVEQVMLGAGFAFAAAVQPGPLQAFLLGSVSRNGWRRTLPAAFSPLLSDGPIGLACLIVISAVPAGMISILRTIGGLFLLYLAWQGFSDWRKGSPEDSPSKGTGAQSLWRAAIVNLLNPNPYLGWTLVLGPAFRSAWSASPWRGIALLSAFYGTMVLSLAGTVFLFGTTSHLGPAVRRRLMLASSIVLACLAVLQLVLGLSG